MIEMAVRKRTREVRAEEPESDTSSIESDSDYGPSGCDSSDDDGGVQTRSKSKRKRLRRLKKLDESTDEQSDDDEDDEDGLDEDGEEDDELGEDLEEELGNMAKEIAGQFLIVCRRKRPADDMSDDSDNTSNTLSKQLAVSKIPEPFRTQYVSRAKRLEACGEPDEKERTFLERVLRIPFGNYKGLVSGETKDERRKHMLQTRKAFDDSVYGMEHVKSQMVQIVAQALAAGGTCRPRIVCLVGSAGCGKTLIASKGLANALNRPVVHLAMASLTDTSSLVGCSMFYHGSHPGGIVDGLVGAGCMDPILVFDEVDKIAGNENGKSIMNMLIHLTDPLQNSTFRDAYFTPLPIDLSACVMVFLCNDVELIHPILRDRMHIIRVKKQSSKDKFEISKRFMWKEVVKQLGLQKTLGDRMTLSDEAIEVLVKNGSTEKCEGGMRAVKRQMETIALYINSEHLFGNFDLPCALSVAQAKQILEEMCHHDDEVVVEGLSTSVQHMYI